MRAALLLLLFSPLFSLQASEDSPFSYDEKSPLGEILKISQVKTIYESDCKEKGTDELADCLWEKIEESPDLKQQVLSQLEDNNKGLEERTSNIDYGVVKKKKDPVLEKMEDYLKDRLIENFYGKDPKQKKLVDHDNFYTLYKTQLGKNVISTISSYCIEEQQDSQNSDLRFISAKDSERKTARENNVKRLRVNNAQQSPKNYWDRCTLSIQDICYLNSNPLVDTLVAKGIAVKKQNGMKTIDYKVFEAEKAQNPGSDMESYVYTHQRACEVTEYIKKSREAILNVEYIEDIKEKRKGKHASITFNNLKYYGDDSDSSEKNLDELTTASSNEVVNASGVQEEAENQKEKFKECFNDNSIVDASKCNAYLNSNVDESKRIIADTTIKAEALQAKIDNLDQAGVEKVLEEEGYSEEEINQLVSTDPDKIKEEIQNRYEIEKQALIKSLSAQVASKTAKNDGEVNGDDLENLKKIEQDLENKSESYKQLTHFNNIISSYIDIKSGDGDDAEISANTTAAIAELEDSAYDSSRNPSSGDDNSNNDDGQHFSEVERSLQESGRLEQNSNSDGDASTLSVEEINNNLIKYE